MATTPKTLIVDDNTELLDNLSELLQDEGVEVVTVPGGAGALEVLERDHFDLVITDLRMPGMDGIEVLRVIRERWPELRVIVMTAYSMDAVIERAQAYGALGVLPKPLDLAYMIELVGRMLAPEAAVLLVEDDAELRINLTEAMVEEAKVVPHPCSDLQSARRLADAARFQAAIIDVRLPDGDGTALGEELRERHPGMPILYITGYGDELRDTLRTLVGSPEIRLLEKPFSPSALIELIRQSL